MVQILFQVEQLAGKIVFYGINSGYSATTASQNTCYGSATGSSIITGNQNICLGYNTASGLTTGSNGIYIGFQTAPLTSSETNTCRISNIRGTTTLTTNGIPVLIDSNNMLGTTSSTRDVKTQVAPMQNTTDMIMKLNPVQFKYKCVCQNECQIKCCCEENEGECKYKCHC